MPQEFIPFKNIGLCFSGGGYRATFYSLGIISYLNRIKFKDKSLLEAASALSSVSGGTILAVAYAKAAQQPDYSFNTFYKTFYTAFTPKHDTLLKTAIAKLTDDAVWKANPHKTRSIINAFALTYAEMELFTGNFSVFTNPVSTNLKDVCFNATDFSYGLSFRFQNGEGEFGNLPLKNTNAAALLPQIPLGDIVASSSCFPLGFEPMLFPKDYCKDHTNTDYSALKENESFKDGVGIMDGGIADNQGIASMQMINKRRPKKEKLDLIIVNDVSSFMMDAWKPTKETTTIKKITVAQSLGKVLGYFRVKPVYWFLLLSGLSMVLFYLSPIIRRCLVCTKLWFYSIGLFVTSISLVLIVLSTIAASKKKKIQDGINSYIQKEVPKPILNELDTFKNLDINVVQRMLTNRISSSVKMISEVFLKQIRRLTYDLLYKTPTLKNKHITTTVYSLNGKPTPYTGGKFKYNTAITPKPSEQLTAIGLIASSAPTSLWWDAEDINDKRMDSLIACGQFTMCYELIEYVLKLKNLVKKQKEEVEEEGKIIISPSDMAALDVILVYLLKDWSKFNEDPLFMV